MTENLQAKEWDTAYDRGQNYCFYPHEEVVCFFARNVCRRVAPDEFQAVAPGYEAGLKMIDLGCGIGAHIVFAHRCGVEAHGADLSSKAVTKAREWAASEGVPDVEERIVEADLRALPWPDAYFNVAVSHGVFDSMAYDIARAGILEARRVLKPGALLHLDLIAGDIEHGTDFAGEEIRETEHEEGTVQSYFDRDKIERLLADAFAIERLELIRNSDGFTGTFHSRWHLVAEAIG